MVSISPRTDILWGAIGGILVALSSTALYYATGNILGVSGVLGTSVSSRKALKTWRLPFFVGILASGVIFAALRPSVFGTASSTLSPFSAAVAGILVGSGTRMAGGCTSGHGVVGLARLSPRSLTAVMTFMGAGMFMAYLVRAAQPFADLVSQGAGAGSLIAEHGGAGEAAFTWASPAAVGAGVGVLAAAALLGAVAFRKGWRGSSSAPPAPTPASEPENGLLSPELVPPPSAAVEHDSVGAKAAGLLTGVMFGTGLCLSGMTDMDRVIGFLDLSRPQGWDLTLMAVMGGAVLVNLVTFRWMSRNLAKPLYATVENVATPPKLVMGACGKNRQVDAKLVVGSLLFGLGWGLGGICPGPGLVAAAAGVPASIVIAPGILLGMAAHDLALEAYAVAVPSSAKA